MPGLTFSTRDWPVVMLYSSYEELRLPWKHWNTIDEPPMTALKQSGSDTVVR